MNYTKISLIELCNKCIDWALEIDKVFHPDIVIYVAKAGFLIGYQISKTLNVPLIGIDTVREKGNKIKELVAPIVRKMPDFIRNILITVELKSGVHAKNDKRITGFIDFIDDWDKAKKWKILIVDDSIDTGASITAVRKCVLENFPHSNIKIAGLNVWDKSKEKIYADFALYENTVIKTPMSKDSNEYDAFILLYTEFLNRGEVNG